MDLREIVDYWLLCFVSIFAVVNPLRAAEAFHRSFDGVSPTEARRAARTAVLVAFAVLFPAAWVGNHLIAFSGIRVGGFRVAACVLILAWVARDMLRDHPWPASTPAPAVSDAASPQEKAVVPFGIPLLAGAPSIATVTLYSGETHELWRRLVTIAALAVTLGATWVALAAARHLVRALGSNGIRYITHAMGLTIAAWCVDFIATGIRDLLPLILQTPPAQ